MIKIDTLKEVDPTCYNNLRSWLKACGYEEHPEILMDEEFYIDKAMSEEDNNLRDALLISLLLEDFFNVYTYRNISVECTRTDGYHVRINTNVLNLDYAGGNRKSLKHTLIDALIEYKRMRSELPSVNILKI